MKNISEKCAICYFLIYILFFCAPKLIDVRQFGNLLHLIWKINMNLFKKWVCKNQKNFTGGLYRFGYSFFQDFQARQFLLLQYLKYT